jgi:predicted negative regulator of RcsB-dependent stress response
VEVTISPDTRPETDMTERLREKLANIIILLLAIVLLAVVRPIVWGWWNNRNQPAVVQPNGGTIGDPTLLAK